VFGARYGTLKVSSLSGGGDSIVDHVSSFVSLHSRIGRPDWSQPEARFEMDSLPRFLQRNYMQLWPPLDCEFGPIFQLMREGRKNENVSVGILSFGSASFRGVF